ncbi:UDP-N-acetylmuramoyl-L-alanyl-D-glutamate--2,6-diaminopimelate ligase [Candidatus Kuenenbacteria bacterium]|nr:UDP-N-acetylmuramoyl-L-alanyl-D-glutamate--2,6-diaminopimelate ligase [Candidatus Kuenenbacteria bacterium]
MVKKIIKKLLPEKVILFYHYLVALVATVIYGWPGKKMVVIGITGTKGKTSTANFIWATLMAGGHKMGIITTASIRIGEQETMNKYHMTMPGRFVIQKTMAEMVKAGCEYCIVETTSEGLKQHRNVGVYYDWAIFTNLTPEHLPSHGGSFENYKKAKGKMFVGLAKQRKKIGGQEIEKVIIANKDSEHADYYLNFPADKKITYSLKKESDVKAEQIKETVSGVDFVVGGKNFKLGILGGFNVYNAMPAIIVGRLAGMSDEKINKGLSELNLIPGRMEIIDEGQNFTVIVDYAHEKQSITYVLETGRAMRKPGAKVIILLGAEGGGRDKAKRPIMGELSAKLADQVVVSNVDPYEDDPKEILEDIATVAEQFGKKRGEDLWVIEDRREGIAKALAMAGENDIVIITGKGAEQSIVIGGQSRPWDDRVVVREELKKII